MFDHLPKDLLINILLRLPPKSILICASVCKSWNSLITNDHDFLISHHHLHRHNHHDPLMLHLYRLKHKVGNDRYTDQLYLCTINKDQINSKNVLILSKFPFTHDGNLSLVGTCSGLLCLSDYSPSHSATSILWNPSIRKYVILPKPSITFDHNVEKYRVLLGFGFDPRTEDFKVVRFVSLYDDQDTHPQVEVYSLASGSWKSVTNSSSRAIPNYFTDWDAHSSPAQIVIRGVIHWVVSQKSSNGETHKFILSFDLRKETFGELMLPKVVRELCRSEASILQGDCCNTRLNYKWEKHCFRFFRKFLKMKKKDGSFGDEDRWEKVFRFDSRCCYGCVKNIVGLKTNGEVFLELLSGRLLLVRKIATHMLSTTSCKDTSVGCFVESLFLLSKQNNAFSYT